MWNSRPSKPRTYPVNRRTYPINNFNLKANNSDSYLCISVFFHIVRNTNGTKAFTEPNLDAIITYLNKFYGNHKIVFNNSGSEFINNSEYVNVNSNAQAQELGGVNNRENAINFYIVEGLKGDNGASLNGTANKHLSNEVVIRSDKVFTSTTPHELGHCFDLRHYYGNQNNIMITGVDPTKRVEFTSDQIYTMRDVIQNETLLKNTIGASCTLVTQGENVCYSQSRKVSIASVAAVAWNSSNNVNILSNTNSNADVLAVNSNSTGSGWVKATLNNGVILQENFKVGVPYGYSQGKIEVHPWSGPSGGLFYQNWTRMHIANVYPFYGYTDWEWYAQYSMVRPSNTIDIMIKPISIGYTTIKARRKNECGCGTWISKVFDVTRESGGRHRFRK
jgi:hypothetical protein